MTTLLLLGFAFAAAAGMNYYATKDESFSEDFIE
ncbi:hypothetical protein MEZE111188_04550 [Mesobacillus zeae]